MNKLLEYLPPMIYEHNKEIQQITSAELPEIESLWGGIERVRDNQFITTSDSNRIRLWERLLNIRPDLSTQDLEYRKDIVLLRLGLTPPFTYKWLETLLTDGVGEGNFTIKLDYSNYLIDIRITHKDVNMINELRVFFREVLPANIVTATKNVEIKKARHTDIIPTIIAKTGNRHKGVASSRNIKIIQDLNKVKTICSGLAKTVNKHKSMPVERNRKLTKELEILIGYVGLSKTYNKHISTLIDRPITVLKYKAIPTGLLRTVNKHKSKGG